MIEKSILPEPQCPQVARLSLVDSAIVIIRSQVESGAWKVGERIPKEDELAEMLRVGRNTVREAVRVLSHANMLEVRQGDGTYVRSNVDPGEMLRRVDRASLHDHFELRATLETDVARLAATRRTKADIEDMTRLLDERGEIPPYGSTDFNAFVARDLAFHLAIARAAHNAAMEELYGYFLKYEQQHLDAYFGRGDVIEPNGPAHARVLEAIIARNPVRAARAARAILAPVIKTLKG
ncbi:MAG: FCD domain-containing protein [Methylovirgula sp.]|uniref:FadR/GntR family transcriptional regulator n=1 Tax=Methylovirgula sp. TaxID=1978224 RepID=UPI00307647A6